MDALDRFIEAWREPLEQRAIVAFAWAKRAEDFRPHHEIADEFVQSHGFKSIGFNWEMLDGAPDASGPRAASQVIADALTKDMTTGRDWLGAGAANQCASDFANAFNASSRTILSNRYDGLWNPITEASMEYALVGFDARAIALLVISTRD